MGFFRRLKTTLQASPRRPADLWIALIVLNGLIFLPSVLLRSEKSLLLPLPPLHEPGHWFNLFAFFVRREGQDLFRLCADLLAMVTLMALVSRFSWKRWVRYLLWPVYLLLLAYQSYDFTIRALFGQKPLLYSDVLHLRDALTLASDLTASLALTLAGIAALLALLAWASAYLFKALELGLERLPFNRKTLMAGLTVWGSVLVLGLAFGWADYRPTVQWVAPRFVANLETSGRWRAAVESLPARLPVDSSYFAYDGLRLQYRPDVYFIVLESYGKILARDSHLQGPYRRLMEQMQRDFGRRGWHCATNYSEAPVKGARSWLSAATLLTGLRLDNQVAFDLFQEHAGDFPHLVRFLNRHNYFTLLLQPPTRPRHGLPVADPFGFEQVVHYDTLKYRGPEYGWGIIPDQYSLGYVHHHYLRRTYRPTFLFFETVTSHAPWGPLPPLVDDWRALNGRPVPPASPDTIHLALWQDVVLVAQNAALRARRALRLGGALDPGSYFQHVAYDWNVISDYLLRQAPDHSLFIIVGDHQPPFLTPMEYGYQTPIHLLSKDPALIQLCRDYGFETGLSKDPGRPGVLRHEGIFSFLVQLLARHYGAEGYGPPPQYHSAGVPFPLAEP
ncbi:MAG: hypothetical protein C4524_06155 [Candidatus Zixiibacteriota bacterium]|nr:MAG: hypothetical protein C4524_06155 [candidate division Zixibacteria bacterium]